MSKTRVGLLFGGRSVEHEVSLVSATSIRDALDSDQFEVIPIGVDHDGCFHLGEPCAPLSECLAGPEVLIRPAPNAPTLLCPERQLELNLDVFFPIIHGTGGEDGVLQGLLELSGTPYVGSGVASSAIQMDKDLTKQILEAGGVRVVPWISLYRHQLADISPDRWAELEERALHEIGLPLFVKPASLGSSVGIRKVKSAGELLPAIREATRLDTKVLLERAVDGREIEVAVLGNAQAQASIPGEICPKSEFYDYEAKYEDGTTELRIPAPLSEIEIDEVQQTALKAFSLLEASGFARVDFFLDRQSGEFFLNEVNSLPGFTSVSMFPRLWEATGLAYPQLLAKLIALALEHHREISELERNYSSP